MATEKLARGSVRLVRYAWGSGVGDVARGPVWRTATGRAQGAMVPFGATRAMHTADEAWRDAEQHVVALKCMDRGSAEYTTATLDFAKSVAASLVDKDGEVDDKKMAVRAKGVGLRLTRKIEEGFMRPLPEESKVTLMLRTLNARFPDHTPNQKLAMAMTLMYTYGPAVRETPHPSLPELPDADEHQVALIDAADEIGVGAVHRTLDLKEAEQVFKEFYELLGEEYVYLRDTDIIGQLSNSDEYRRIAEAAKRCVSVEGDVVDVLAEVCVDELKVASATAKEAMTAVVGNSAKKQKQWKDNDGHEDPITDGENVAIQQVAIAELALEAQRDLQEKLLSCAAEIGADSRRVQAIATKLGARLETWLAEREEGIATPEEARKEVATLELILEELDQFPRAEIVAAEEISRFRELLERYELYGPIREMERRDTAPKIFNMGIDMMEIIQKHDPEIKRLTGGRNLKDLDKPRVVAVQRLFDKNKDRCLNILFAHEDEWSPRLREGLENLGEMFLYPGYTRVLNVSNTEYYGDLSVVDMVCKAAHKYSGCKEPYDLAYKLLLEKPPHLTKAHAGPIVRESIELNAKNTNFDPERTALVIEGASDNQVEGGASAATSVTNVGAIFEQQLKLLAGEDARYGDIRPNKLSGQARDRRRQTAPSEETAELTGQGRDAVEHSAKAQQKARALELSGLKCEHDARNVEGVVFSVKGDDHLETSHDRVQEKCAEAMQETRKAHSIVAVAAIGREKLEELTRGSRAAAKRQARGDGAVEDDTLTLVIWGDRTIEVPARVGQRAIQIVEEAAATGLDNQAASFAGIRHVEHASRNRCPDMAKTLTQTRSNLARSLFAGATNDYAKYWDEWLGYEPAYKGKVALARVWEDYQNAEDKTAVEQPTVVHAYASFELDCMRSIYQTSRFASNQEKAEEFREWMTSNRDLPTNKFAEAAIGLMGKDYPDIEARLKGEIAAYREEREHLKEAYEVGGEEERVRSVRGSTAVTLRPRLWGLPSLTSRFRVGEDGLVHTAAMGGLGAMPIIPSVFCHAQANIVGLSSVWLTGLGMPKPTPEVLDEAREIQRAYRRGEKEAAIVAKVDKYPDLNGAEQAWADWALKAREELSTRTV